MNFSNYLQKIYSSSPSSLPTLPPIFNTVLHVKKPMKLMKIHDSPITIATTVEGYAMSVVLTDEAQ